MFYSHEILSSRQYGVATIWLVATVGSGQRKLTKKAIQEVNVPKACERILDPGAPLALRLQGSLLYGVSRVFAQQCTYVLTDAEKTQSDMMTFFRVMQKSDIDPQAGKTKRQNIVLQDDPDFDPFGAFPNLDLLNWDKELVLLPSQGSAGRFSQMTPLGSVSQQSSLSSRHSAMINLEIPPSSQSGASYRIPSDFGQHSPLFGKSFHGRDRMPEFQPFGDDEFAPISGIGLDFDADGNLISVIDQDEDLPPLHGQDLMEKEQGYLLENAQNFHAQNVDGKNLLTSNEENLPDLGEAAQPDAVVILNIESVKKPAHGETETSETTETEQASTKMGRARRPKPHNMLDNKLLLPAQAYRDWFKNYVTNMEDVRNHHKATSNAQSKKNAYALLFENGIANVGNYHRLSGLSHPLAADFAGHSLKARIQGKEPSEMNQSVANKRGRRRKSDEAFENENNETDLQRNTRPRVDEAELGRGDDYQNDGHAMFDDHSLPEVGMDAVLPMDDRHSSSMMPWSRPGSVVPGSSVRGSAQKAKTAPSPLFSQGSAMGPIDRLSDPVEPLFGLDDFDLHDSSFQFAEAEGNSSINREGDSQVLTEGLDAASQQFLGYASEKAVVNGVKRGRGPENRRWIEFDELADPNIHSKAVAAQAFLHVLSLATKNAISVEQDGAEKKRPFGTIRIGVDATEEAVEQAESEDELA